MKQLTQNINTNTLAYQLWELKKQKIDEGVKRQQRILNSPRATPATKARATTKLKMGRKSGRDRGIGAKDFIPSKRSRAKVKRKIGDMGAKLNAKVKIGADNVRARFGKAKENASATFGKAKGNISAKMRSGADSVKRFGKGTMHGMKKGMQGTKGFKKGTAQKRGQWTGNKLRQGYRGAKQLGRKGFEGAKSLGKKGWEGAKKHGPTVAKGLKKGVLGSLHHGAKAGREAIGAVKSGWKAGGPKPIAPSGKTPVPLKPPATGKPATGQPKGGKPPALGPLKTPAQAAQAAQGGGGGNTTTGNQGNVTVTNNLGGQGGGQTPPPPKEVLSRRQQLKNAKTAGLVARKAEHHATGGYRGKIGRAIAGATQATAQVSQRSGGNL
tara:strand:+ start:212 stop:1357 length:1146 start_codon:yes stop_codon:yes gene_type:complete